MAHVRVVLLAVLLAGGCTRLVDPDNAVVATVDREKIRIGDVLYRISQTPPADRLEANSPEGRLQIVEDLINETVLLMAAEDQGITVTEDEVQQRLAESDAQARSGGAQGQDAIIEAVPDPELAERILLMEKVTAPHLAQEEAEARYRALLAGPPQITVQYEFFSVLASDPTFAMDIQREMQGGTAVNALMARYRSHPSFVSAGTAEPVLLRLVAPWLQREIVRAREGDLLPPWQTATRGEPSIELIRLLQVWEYPPFAVSYPYLIDELYQEHLESLKRTHTITRYPERLQLIDRR